MIERTKTAALTVFTIFVVLVLFLMILFVPVWYDHTEFVQSLVEEQYEKVREDSINWSLTDPNSREDLRADLLNTLTRGIPLFVIEPYNDEVYTFREDIYDLIILLDDTNSIQFKREFEEMSESQNKMYVAMQKFIINTSYAMRFTLI